MEATSGCSVFFLSVVKLYSPFYTFSRFSVKDLWRLISRKTENSTTSKGSGNRRYNAKSIRLLFVYKYDKYFPK